MLWGVCVCFSLGFFGHTVSRPELILSELGEGWCPDPQCYASKLRLLLRAVASFACRLFIEAVLGHIYIPLSRLELFCSPSLKRHKVLFSEPSKL